MMGALPTALKRTITIGWVTQRTIVTCVLACGKKGDLPLDPSRRLYAPRASSAGPAGNEACSRPGDAGKSDIDDQSEVKRSARQFPRAKFPRTICNWKFGTSAEVDV